MNESILKRINSNDENKKRESGYVVICKIKIQRDH